jgi:hypothetical protein
MRTYESAASLPACRLAVLAALLCHVVLLGGCVRVPIPLGSVETTSAPAETEMPPSSVAPTEAVSAGRVGAQHTTGPWSVAVTRASLSREERRGLKPPPGKAFLLLEVQFRNVGVAEEISARPEYFSLRNAAGKRFPTVGTDAGANLHGMQSIDPGYGAITVLVYEVPKKSASYVFTFAPKVAGEKLGKVSWRVP